MLADKLLDVAQVGATGVLYLLIVLSVISIGIIVERFGYFWRRRVDSAALGKQVLAGLHAGEPEQAREALARSRSVEAAVLADALGWYGEGDAAVAEIVQASLKEKKPQFESGLLFLGTLGNNAPFIGLFGTVLGVVHAFRELGAATGATGGGMGNVMSGIAEALIATAIGILVAIPAVIAYNAFQKKCVDIEENVAALGGLVLAHMKGARHGVSPRGEAARARADGDGSERSLELGSLRESEEAEQGALAVSSSNGAALRSVEESA